MIKRIFDIVIAGISLIALSVPIALISLLILVKLGRPVIFQQLRPGLRGKPFKIFKFRTMKILFNKSGKLASDEERITRFGAWLRHNSLDELPTLWNVLIGDMSIVGPRPLLMEYLDLYTTEQMSRHNVRPGITGWAQVNGRNQLSWEEKFKLDVWYVNNNNFLLDVKILFKTMLLVIRSTGINQEGCVTSEKFRGSN